MIKYEMPTGESHAMDTEEHGGFTFPVGYQRFHRDQMFNFQLNRPYSLGYARFEDLQEAGQRIGTFDEWKVETLRLATESLDEGRLVNSAFYYRAAEFYTFPDDPDKERFYDRFSDLFYRAFAKHGIERIRIPYGDTTLPAIALRPEGKMRGTIVLHGGYDSFIEEFFSLMYDFKRAGFRVIGFDGPGAACTGRALRIRTRPFDSSIVPDPYVRA